MAQKYLEKLSILIPELFSENQFKEIEIKHFFSGAALYINGTIFITLTPKGLAIKLPFNMREELFKEKKAKPLRYFPKAPIKKEYVLLSKEATKNTTLLKNLAIQSAKYVEEIEN